MFQLLMKKKEIEHFCSDINLMCLHKNKALLGYIKYLSIK